MRLPAVVLMAAIVMASGCKTLGCCGSCRKSEEKACAKKCAAGKAAKVPEKAEAAAESGK